MVLLESETKKKEAEETMNSIRKASFRCTTIVLVLLVLLVRLVLQVLLVPLALLALLVLVSLEQDGTHCNGPVPWPATP